MSPRKDLQKKPNKLSSEAVWIKLGIVGRAHGLRGFFFISERRDLIPSEYSELVIGDTPQTGALVKIRESRMQANRPVLLCDIAASREEASALTGKGVWVNRDRIEVNESAEYLWADLEGKKVIDCEGAEVGIVRKVYNAGASDILELVSDQFGLLDIPLTMEFFNLLFSAKDAELHLIVPKNIFDEFWRKAY